MDLKLEAAAMPQPFEILYSFLDPAMHSVRLIRVFVSVYSACVMGSCG